jgi:A/G-specific adenine glycosylase
MLQQTQVDTVIPYYSRFLSRFPTPGSLAAASLQDVLKVWENLGYYARARNLHQAALDIMAQWNGRLPPTMEGLKSLPGIGNYTASAIMSMAYGERFAAVDGNIRRVLCRVFLIRKPVHEISTLKHIHDLAQQMVPKGAPGSYNQALMDLGATVCTPRRPDCPQCPLPDLCQARLKGLQEKIPLTKRRPPVPQREGTAGIIRNGSGEGFLIVRRRAQGLLGGLWKFPGGMKAPEETLEEALKRSILEELGIKVVVQGKIASTKHTYTHFRITLYAFGCTLKEGRPKALSCSNWCWAEAGNLSRFPFSKAERKIMSQLGL